MFRFRSLADRRLALGISQEHIGREAGVAQAEVSRAERGKGSPRVVRLIRGVLCRLERLRGPAWRREKFPPKPPVVDPYAASRAAAAAVPWSREYEHFQEEMIGRVWELWQGSEVECEKADALLEFLPSTVVDALLEQFWESDDPLPEKALEAIRRHGGK